MEARHPFNGIFIRAPVVEKILPTKEGIQIEENMRDDTVVAPSRSVVDSLARQAMGNHRVEVLAKLPGRAPRLVAEGDGRLNSDKETGDIVAVRQGNVFGTSFHPELTDDPRVHLWWLRQVLEAVNQRRLVRGNNLTLR